MRTVTVNASVTYDVLIGPGLLDRAGSLAAGYIKPCRAMIVTDSTVDALYGSRCAAAFEIAGFKTEKFVFPAGEPSKNIMTLSDILEAMAEARISRSDIVVALGGGVAGDMAGFAAAIFNRGMRFIQIPTTLLAAVDSSVGGKTAIDLKAGKNLAGAFHQPSLVITDTDVIRDLPKDQLSCGAAEVIKYGVLSDISLFEIMEKDEWLGDLEEIIGRCVENKRDAVAEDEFDTGARQFLNLGHTFGHAIEKCSDFSILHGQGVAIGMVMAANAAGMDKESILRLAACIRKNGLPVRTELNASTLSEAALSDKKRTGGSINLVLPEAIGKCILRKIPVEELTAYFERALAGQEGLDL
ncbi:MAG: 3-dehydroquinate synthase [Clostridia bacterium]|nr:3-dehydroquinate synthase [Clostridia bacterium]